MNQLKQSCARAFAIGLVLSGLAACAGTGATIGALSPSSFRSAQHPFLIKYSESDTRQIIGPDWTLENTQPQSSGSSVLVSKTGPTWESVVRFDVDGDGVFDRNETIRDAELIFRHTRSDAAIWLSVYPIPQRREHTDLEVLAREYVEGVSGTANISKVQVGTSDAWIAGTERRYATRVVSGTPMSVSGYEAFKVTFEVANVDQLQLSADARWTRASLVIVRPGWWWEKGRSVWPSLLVMGYGNAPDRFANSEGQFMSLVSRLRIYPDVEQLREKGPEYMQCLKTDLGPNVPDSAVITAVVGADGVVKTVYSQSPGNPALNVARCGDEVFRDMKLVATGAKREVIAVARATYEKPAAVAEREATSPTPSGEPEQKSVEAAVPAPER